MHYSLNFGFIWLYIDRLAFGLMLSLEITVVAIAIAATIGFSLALLFNLGNRVMRLAIAAYVEIFRNVPLLLLVYLVFYGIPSVAGVAYRATTSFILTLGIYGGAYLVEVFRAGFEAIPKGLIEAGKVIGMT